MRITTTVKVDNRFPQLTRGYDKAIVRALRNAAQAGAETSRAAAAQRSRSGTMADMRVLPVLPDRRGASRGYTGAFRTSAYYAKFHEHGTLGSRKKALKRPGSRTRTGQGIKPLRFLAKGRATARGRLLIELKRELD